MADAGMDAGAGAFPVTIALDGSLHDASTLSWGTTEAALRRASVELVRVVGGHGRLVRGEWLPTPHREAHTEEAMYLERLLERESARRPGLTVTMRLVQEPWADALETVSRTSQLLVVRPLHDAAGHTAERKVVQVVGRARCPVAVVTGRPGGHGTAPVVVGVDGSPESRVAARLAADEAALRRAALVVLHVTEHVPDHRAPRGAKHAASSAGAVDAVVIEIRGRRPDLEVRVDVVDGAPADALVERSARAGLLVVGSRGLGTVRGTLLGSVSSDVMGRAVGTVLVVPQPAIR